MDRILLVLPCLLFLVRLELHLALFKPIMVLIKDHATSVTGIGPRTPTDITLAASAVHTRAR